MPFFPWVGIDATLTVPVNLQGTGTNPVFGAGTVGDAANRIEMGADGRLRGGDGTNPTDATWFRTAPNQWQTNSDILLHTAGKGLRVAEGANGKQGTAVLVAGTVTVANTNITANSRIVYSRSTTGGTVGHLSTTQTAGTGFTINSSSATDTSTIVYEIFEPG